MTARERAIVAALADAVVAPEPPLPPVSATDTVDAFGRWLDRAPALNRTALRAALLVLGTHLRARPRQSRIEALHRSRAPGLRQLTEALQACVSGCYFGDLEVMRLLGYDAEANVARARVRAPA